MDFKTPKSSQLTEVAIMGASSVLGAAGSNIAVAQIIGKSQEGDDPQKTENKRRWVKGASVVGSLGLLAFTHGNDPTALAIKGLCLGAAASQGISLIREFIDHKTDHSEMVKQAVGLGCSCSNGMLRQPVWFEPIPSYSEPYPIETPSSKNPLANFSKGKLQGYAQST